MWTTNMALVCLLLSPTTGLAADDEMAKVAALRDQAQNASAYLLARLAAVDELGQVKTKDKATAQDLLRVFRDLLNHPKVEAYERDLFRLHVIQAIANIGPDLAALGPDLPRYVGSERLLNQAIADTLRRIRAGSSDSGKAAEVKPKPQP